MDWTIIGIVLLYLFLTSHFYLNVAITLAIISRYLITNISENKEMKDISNTVLSKLKEFKGR